MEEINMNNLLAELLASIQTWLFTTAILCQMSKSRVNFDTSY